MQTFLNENFLLKNKPARTLYHEYAAFMPIIDFHCHINPMDIAVDKHYDTITEAWLSLDHDKRRLIRTKGMAEDGTPDLWEDHPFKLFQAFAQVLPGAVGNPVYHWSCLELKRYFGLETQLNDRTAEEVYEACNEKLQQPEMSARGLLTLSNVRLICTLDDPIDSLIYHRKIAADPTCQIKVLPTFRPYKAVHLEDSGFSAYIAKLSDASGIFIRDFNTLCAALTSRINFFDQMGCRTADHTLERCVYRPTTPEHADAVFKRALAGEAVTDAEAERYYTELLLHLSREYRQRDWVMQFHFGYINEASTRMTRLGGMCSGSVNGLDEPHRLAGFLNTLEENDELPRMILHNQDPDRNTALASICSCFMADAECPGKIQMGAVWRLNDYKTSMEKQLRDLANSTLLSNFVGAFTDGYSCLSYPRHEYFRRILCNFMGQMVEDGEYPADYNTLGKLVEAICFYNAERFFGLDI